MADKPSVRVLHRAVDSDDDEQHSSQSGSPQQSLQELKASNDSLKQRLEQVRVRLPVLQQHALSTHTCTARGMC